jgi:DNA-damage-inducible protein J
MRLEHELKTEVAGILGELGLSMADAVTVFFKQIKLNGGLPFEIKIPKPNDITLRTMKETDEDINMRYFDSAEGMFKELGI